MNAFDEQFQSSILNPNMRKISLLIFFCSAIISAQELPLESSDEAINSEKSIIEVSIKNGVEDQDLQTFFQFENISQTEFSFNGDAIKGKFFIVKVKEFLDGELTETSVLFDERGNDYFKIDSTQTSFKLLNKIENDEMKFWIKGQRFGSKQGYFPTTKLNGEYAVKDFFGAKKLLKEDANEPFYLQAVITPNRNPDGSGSYCKVAQSEILPEEFGKEFNIPHYYLVEIEFTE